MTLANHARAADEAREAEGAVLEAEQVDDPLPPRRPRKLQPLRQRGPQQLARSAVEHPQSDRIPRHQHARLPIPRRRPAVRLLPEESPQQPVRSVVILRPAARTRRQVAKTRLPRPDRLLRRHRQPAPATRRPQRRIRVAAGRRNGAKNARKNVVTRSPIRNPVSKTIAGTPSSAVRINDRISGKMTVAMRSNAVRT